MVLVYCNSCGSLMRKRENSILLITAVGEFVAHLPPAAFRG